MQKTDGYAASSPLSHRGHGAAGSIPKHHEMDIYSELFDLKHFSMIVVICQDMYDIQRVSGEYDEFRGRNVFPLKSC